MVKDIHFVDTRCSKDLQAGNGLDWIWSLVVTADGSLEDDLKWGLHGGISSLRKALKLFQLKDKDKTITFKIEKSRAVLRKY